MPAKTMFDLLCRLWPLKRSLVSDGYDKAIRIISEDFPISVAEFPSGTECWTWFVPEKWTCREAWVETLDGRRLIDYESHPLHCVEYSLPIDGVIDREELLSHLHVHPKNPEAIPYVFKFYDRNWGFCCSQRTRNELKDQKYRVRIDSDFTQGTLKVGEWWLPGKSKDTIVLAAHLCHPYLANDDLSGVVVGLEVMKRLSALKDRHYTFLLLLVPETIGSIAWLSHNEQHIPNMRGGIFLEMLGLDIPHGLARSYAGNTQIDLCCEAVLEQRDHKAFVRDYANIVLNDELEFNSPLLRIPMVSLSRSLPRDNPDYPYPEYHTHFDSPDIVHQHRLEESTDIAFEMLDRIDRNAYAKVKAKGQVFCSRYGLFPKTLKQQTALIKVLYELDGLHSIADICKKHSIDFEDAAAIISSFQAKELVDTSMDPFRPECQSRRR